MEKLEEIPFWMVKDFKPKPKDFIFRPYKYTLIRINRTLYPVKTYKPARLSFDRKLIGRKSFVPLCGADLEHIRPECLPSLVRLLNQRLINFRKKYLEEQARLGRIFYEEMQRRKNTDRGRESGVV